MKIRFSLRQLLIATALIAAAVQVLLYLTADLRARMAIERNLSELGAYWVNVGDNRSISASFHSPIASSEIAKFGEIKTLDFKEAHITDESLQNLRGLKSVGFIVFGLSDVQDDQIRLLKNIGRVRALMLTHTNLTDGCIDSLIELNGLETVVVSKAGLFSRQGLERLHAALPELKIVVQ